MASRLQFENDTQSPVVDMFENEYILSQFLHDMDELDWQQNLPFEYCEADESEPAFKKIKSMERSSGPSKTQVVITRPPRKRRNTSWLRRKQELHALRRESEKLEARVALGEMQRAQSQFQVISATTEDQDKWKPVAVIAQQECQNSLHQNAHLKTELQLYVRASELLQAQLIAAESHQRQLRENRMAFENAVRVGVIMTRRLGFDNNGVFSTLEGRINSRFYELDAIIRETRIPTEQGNTENVQICREVGKNAAAAVEFKHVRLLPFGEDATANTIWQMIELGKLVSMTDTRVVRGTSNMLGLVSRHTVPLGDKAKVSVDVHTVIKRFEVTVGMVALIESHSEWSIQYPTSVAARSTTEEGGWVVVREYPTKASSSPNERASQLKTSVKIRLNDDSSANPLTATMVDVVIPSFSSIMSSHHQSIENLLLDSVRPANVPCQSVVQ